MGYIMVHMDMVMAMALTKDHIRYRYHMGAEVTVSDMHS